MNKLPQERDGKREQLKKKKSYSQMGQSNISGTSFISHKLSLNLSKSSLGKERGRKWKRPGQSHCHPGISFRVSYCFFF
jgi:hypothetical protein